MGMKAWSDVHKRAPYICQRRTGARVFKTLEEGMASSHGSKAGLFWLPLSKASLEGRGQGAAEEVKEEQGRSHSRGRSEEA